MAVYFDQDKKTWYCKFRYVDWTGKSRATTKRGFRTKRDAKAYETDFKRQSTENADMTVAELCQRYQSAMESRHRATTKQVVAACIKLCILPKLGTLRLSQLKKDTIMQWQSWMLSQGKSAGTLRARNKTLNAILNYAVKMEYIQRSPAYGITAIGETPVKKDFWTYEQYQRFRAHINDEVDLLAFDLLFFGGFRITELLGIGSKSFDFDRGTITLTAGMRDGKEIPLKNRQSYRTVNIPNSLMKRVRSFLDSLYDVPDIGVLPISRMTLARRMQKYAKDAGLPPITLHGLRHSHVSHLISLGVPITVISKRIGHKNPKVTLSVYSHMYESDSASVADILNEYASVGQTLVKDKK